MRHGSFRFHAHSSSSICVALGVVVLGVVWLATDRRVQAITPTTIVASEQSGPSRFSEWWNGRYASGDWFGVRDILEDEGLTLGGQWTGCYYGVVDGGKPTDLLVSSICKRAEPSNRRQAP